MYDVYVSNDALKKAEAHFTQQAAKGLEAMGLLLGEPRTWQGKEYTFVEEYFTAQNSASSVLVKFSENAFADLVRQYREHRGKIITGWLHSHPSFGCFMSRTDLATQEKFFPEPFHVALVADPTKKEGGRMLLRAYKAADGSYREVSYAVVERRKK
ncbi:MAG: Mov34/MPN/PAD-1 family protein [Candidatus Micrarchaeota archaeon]